MYKNFIIVLVAITFCGLFFTCNNSEEEEYVLPQYVFTSSPTETIIDATTDLLDWGETDTTLLFTVKYGMTNDITATVKATVEPDLSLVEQYNKDYFKEMVPLPESNFSFPENSITIASGTIEASVQFSLLKLDELPNGKYILPVTIKSATASNDFPLHDRKKTAYYLINKTENIIVQTYKGTPHTKDGLPHPVPGTFEAEDFDNGGSNIAYFDDTPGYAAGGRPVYRPDDDVDIGGGGSGLVIAWTMAGEWTNYLIHVKKTGVYRISTIYCSPGGGEGYRLYIDGKDVSGIVTVPSNSGPDWSTYTASSVTVKLTSGVHIFRWQVVSSWCLNADKFTFELT